MVCAHFCKSLAPYLHYLLPSVGFLRRLAAAQPDLTHSVSELIADFLRGSGAPCPEEFNSLQDGFSLLVDFTKLDDPAFRSRIFLWAATGCPTIDPTTSERITVGVCLISANIANCDCLLRLLLLMTMIPFMQMHETGMSCWLQVRYVSEPVSRLFAFLLRILLNSLHHPLPPRLTTPRILYLHSITGFS